MHDAALLGPARKGQSLGRRWRVGLHDFLPRGNMLDDAEWRRRHRLLEWVLLLHVPALAWIGLALHHPLPNVGAAVVAPLVCLMLGHVVRHRRWASLFVTGGLVFCSVTLVLLTRGTIEAHFHFFVIIGFIALYQDWVPFLWNVAFTVLSHGLGTAWLGGDKIFNHPSAQAHPWLWSFIHGVAVLTACIGMVIFWRTTEEEQEGRKALSLELVTASAAVEIGRRQFTSDLLVNLARRNQSMLYRQLDIINQLEDKERDPDALAGLFKIDHLATRIRRNAESLLVLAGEQPPRTWSAPVPLRDVVRAAIAETEDLDRVVFAVDDRVSVSGGSAADLTHLLAELTENAVRFSPPETVVTIRARPDRREEGGHLLTVEDWGVGMPPDNLAEANDLLAHPREVDASVSQRLGFHVVARLAARHQIAVSLTGTPGSGLTAVAILPAALFSQSPATPGQGARPATPDPADTAQLPVTGPAEEPGRRDPARQETVRGADAGPVPPARPFPEPELPAPAAPGSSPTSWSGWWVPEPSTDADATAGANGSNGAARVNGHAAEPEPAAPPAAAARPDPTGVPVDRGSGVAGEPGTPPSGHDPCAPAAAPPAAMPASPATATAPAAAGRDLGGEPDGAETHCPVPPPSPRAAVAQPSPRAAVAQPSPRAAVAQPSPRSAVPAPSPRAAVPAPTPEPAPEAPPASSTVREHEAEQPGPAIPAARSAATPEIPRPTVPPLPGPGRPLAAVPHPRTDEAVRTPEPRGPQSGGLQRALRRRVPQTHLAPELRHAANGLADTTISTAGDGAASALSRYQASRRAAQAVVEVPRGSSNGQGERA